MPALLLNNGIFLVSVVGVSGWRRAYSVAGPSPRSASSSIAAGGAIAASGWASVHCRW